ncbi:HAMP domain-containing sensor histidine kinase [Hymenobacter sp. GOD-10R]|jgi:signal transduction histidine kinase|uniref:sensor histidine kinase n=1 Tax=Hymenobacter sp. GOD-10R TaxID=3093922 RepID=UPI002D782794|nr:HAMP domain-containing sensor histidine kinase [Hymenobacter sp. GOD-10R]WRQ31381.1 HAMP domain-containing sensor histidine kinase [Hymenobacter sp. GOD-10R]
MQIKHKLLLWFAALVSGLLLTFSYYVYVNTAQFRHHSFVERLARKAAVTRQIVALDDSIAGSMLASLPEQAEQVYTPAGRRLYASPGTDYAPSAGLLVRVRQRGQMSFTYQLPGHAHPKEGVALAYRRPDAEGQYVAIVTAYDQEGYAQQQMLFNSFLYGNLAAVALVAALGLFFATRALAPLNFLLRQLRADTARAQPFRLRPLNPRDEAGTLAAAFNDLLTRQEELVESQRAFISHASHELRTPLTTIKGWLETSLAYDSEVASLKKGIGLAVAGLDRLTALANGLLYLARLDSATPLDGQPVELVDVLLDVVSSAQHQHPGQPVDLDISPEVDAQPHTPQLLGNAQLLRTALGNLVDNAAKYSSGQPVTLCLEMEGPATVRLLIEDRGPGIASDEQERIFQPLTRGRAVGEVPGFGIGLTLAQRIILLHQGQLQLRPRLGGGTVAEVQLPLRPAQGV